MPSQSLDAIVKAAQDKVAARKTARMGGKVAAASGQAQHVDMFRKLLLRKKLLAMAMPGPVYVPFIGDGDIAVELYADRKVFGADLDPQRVATASKRLPGSQVIVANCDGWPFPSVKAVFSVADFDAYADPYASFRSWWKNAKRADRLVLFFTDGHRQAIIRQGGGGGANWIKPNGEHEKIHDPARRRLIFNTYFPKYIKPWFVDHIGKEWIIVKIMFYLRKQMIYWGAVIERV